MEVRKDKKYWNKYVKLEYEKLEKKYEQKKSKDIK